MGTGVILLLYYISPIIYADIASRNKILNVDTMYDTVAQAAAIPDFGYEESNKCHPKVAKFSLTEVRCGLVWNNEIPRRQTFWNELVPELMQWLSAQAIECGIYSVIDTEDHHLFTHSINTNSYYWIEALQNLVYSLLQVIAECLLLLQNKADFKSKYTWLQRLIRSGNLDWGQNSFAAYEFWYTAYEYRDEAYPSPLKNIQMVITNSFDILMRWLADYMELRTTTSTSPTRSPPDYQIEFTTLSPTEYSVHLRQVLQKVYLPKSPRRPIIMVWPSVMNLAVYKALLEKLQDDTKKDKVYTIMICDKKSEAKLTIDIDVVKREIHAFDERNRAPKFFDDLVPELILWLCKMALKCGFITFFTNQRDEIYRFINSNEYKYIRAVQELVYILLQVIAVMHHQPDWDDHWIPQWAEAYEKWYKNEERNQTKSALKYFKTIIENSFDIVMAWLFDYLAERARSSRSSRTSIPFWAHADWEKWKLSDDPDIVCALESFDMAPALGWDYLLDKVEDKITVMGRYCLKCRWVQWIQKCDFEGPIRIKIEDKILKPSCADYYFHECSKFPKFPDVPPIPDANKNFLYGHAHMTTAVGHDLYCEINSTSASLAYESADEWTAYPTAYPMQVIALCYPLVVEKYIKDRQYMMCKSKKDTATNTGTITLTKMYPYKE